MNIRFPQNAQISRLVASQEGRRALNEDNTVCRRNRTASGVLLDVVNQSTRSLLSKSRKASRLAFKCNFRNPSKESRIIPAPIFTKLVTAQQNCVRMSRKGYQPNWKMSVETAGRICPIYTTLTITQYIILDTSCTIFLIWRKTQARAKNSFHALK
jgi:hypothetical protein